MTEVRHTRILAEFAANVELPDLPAQSPAILKGLLLDHFGVALGAVSAADGATALIQGILSLGAPGDATILGVRQTAHLLHAAMLNGALAHSLDFDDTYAAGFVHPGAAVVPVSQALIEAGDKSGRDFMTSLAVGYEVACRVGAALGPTAYDRGFHITPIAGIIGGVAGGGRAARFRSPEIESAFGLAGSQAAGSMQYLENGAWNKRLHPGFAAHDALLALKFAEAGVTGATAALEGRNGLLRSYSESPSPALLTDQLGARWMHLDIALKPYPSCRFTHAVIDAAFELRGRFSPDERARAAFRIGLPVAGQKIVAEPEKKKKAPANTVDGQFSVFYNLAVAWLDGTMTLRSYERLRDPLILDTMSRMTSRANESLTGVACTLAVTCDGREETAAVELPLGEPGQPMEWSAIASKFLGLAEPVIGMSAGREIVECVAGLETLRSIRPMLALLQPNGAHSASSHAI